VEYHFGSKFSLNCNPYFVLVGCSDSMFGSEQNLRRLALYLVVRSFMAHKFPVLVSEVIAFFLHIVYMSLFSKLNEFALSVLHSKGRLERLSNPFQPLPN